MPNNNPRTPKSSWRGNQAASPRSSAGQPAWKAEKGAGARPRLSKGMKITIVLSLFLLVTAGGVIVYLWWRPIDPFRLVLVGADYEDNLAAPHNVHGRHGFDGLRKWAEHYNQQSFGEDKSKGKNVDVYPPVGHEADGELTGTKDPVLTQLAGCNAQTVVVFLSGQGGGDVEGAYLLPDDASPAAPTRVYRISTALTALKNLPKTTKKLLLLDGSQSQANWSMGQLHNDFVRALVATDGPAIKAVPNLVVLCSCGSDQQSWASEEYGQTIFGHYVIEGLKGAANQEWPGEDTEGCHFNDPRISTQELAHYVQIQVARWVRHNRASDQQPFLIDNDGIAEGMELAGAEDYKEEQAADLPPWTGPADLRSAWEAHDKLAGSSPPPYVYTPAQWREYEATLLRLEQLLRAGDAGAATQHLHDRLDLLSEQIEQARRRDGRSLPNTLAMPAVFGRALGAEQAKKLQTAFEKSWQENKEADLPNLLSDQSEGLDRPMQQLLRVRLIGLVLDRALQSTDDDKEFKRACEVLPKLTAGADPEIPLPVEANFAVMIRKMADRLPSSAAPPWDLMRQALMVRRAAETAALGMEGEATPAPRSEQLLHWIQTAIETADAQRGPAEDLVLSSIAAERTEARQGLTSAADGYEAARKRAGMLRKALLVRDQALAELPYFTHWRASEVQPAKQANLTDLWAKVDQLCDLLEKPDPDKGLSDVVKVVEEGLARQHGEFDAECRKLQSAPERQTPLMELEALLSAPFIKADDRMLLLAVDRNISWKLNIGTAGADPAADEPTRTALDVKRLAFQQADLALAVLREDSEGGAAVKGKLKELEGLKESEETKNWQLGIDGVGALVAKGFLDKANSAAKAAQDGVTAPLESVAADLHRAALDTRFLDAGMTKAVLGDLDPVDEDRRVQMVNLLVWQAKRSRLDYWDTGDLAEPKPYYRWAAHAYTGDARNLATAGVDKDDAKQKRTTAVDEMNTLADKPGAVAIDWLNDEGAWIAAKGKTAVTDEPDFQLQYKLIGDKDVPDGRPVVWAGPEVKGDRKPLLKVSKPVDAAAPHALKQAAGETPVDYTLVPHPGDDLHVRHVPREDATFQVRGLFRGRLLPQDTTVQLYNRPDLISYQPRAPRDAFIAVQAEEGVFNQFAARNSEMVVVLDYSGSMGQDDKGNDLPVGKRRIDKALTALKTCLQKLPKGVRLTILTFQSDKTGNKAVIATPRDAEPWQPGDKDGLIDKLTDLHPEGATPLVRAVAEAAKHFTGTKAKTILLLTDGGDDMFYAGDGDELRQEVRKEGGKMQDFLHARFDRTGIQVHVVGIELGQLTNPIEIKGAKEFQEAIAGPEGIGGTFDKEENVDHLADDLQQYFLRLHYWIEDRHGKIIGATADNPLKENPTVAEEGLDISKFTKKDAETLRFFRVDPAADYRVILQNHRKHLAGDRTWTQFLPPQGVRVEPGEVLVLNLNPAPDKPDGFELRRDVYSTSVRFRNRNQTLAQSPRDAPPRPWLLTVMGNSRDKDTGEGQEVVAAVENTDDASTGADTLRQSRPSWAWFQITKEGDPKPFSGLRFFPQPYYPAPVWRLGLGDWPASGKPVLDAWWWDKGDLPVDGSYSWVPSDQIHTPLKVKPAGADSVQQVIVESLGIEEREVEVAPGVPERRKCFVVRLLYPPDKPYFAVPSSGIEPTGYEHRFYTDANRYTGIFFDVESIKALKSLMLYSVRDIQADARTLHTNHLPVHGTGDPPQPPAKE
jgi:von Willebrand factor type A domain